MADSYPMRRAARIAIQLYIRGKDAAESKFPKSGGKNFFHETQSNFQRRFQRISEIYKEELRKSLESKQKPPPRNN